MIISVRLNKALQQSEDWKIIICEDCNDEYWSVVSFFNFAENSTKFVETFGFPYYLPIKLFIIVFYFAGENNEFYSYLFSRFELHDILFVKNQFWYKSNSGMRYCRKSKMKFVTSFVAIALCFTLFVERSNAKSGYTLHIYRWKILNWLQIFILIFLAHSAKCIFACKKIQDNAIFYSMCPETCDQFPDKFHCYDKCSDSRCVDNCVFQWLYSCLNYAKNTGLYSNPNNWADCPKIIVEIYSRKTWSFLVCFVNQVIELILKIRTFAWR